MKDSAVCRIEEMNISQWLYREKVESTNDWMKINHEQLTVGSCLYAQTQTKGRGRGSNQWRSPTGGLYFSVLLSKGPKLPNTELLMSHFSYHAMDFLNKRYKLQIQFKAPNDLHVNGCKLMGVLIDNVFMGNCLSACILGVGLNVNDCVKTSVSWHDRPVASLQGLLKEEFNLDKNQLMVEILESYDSQDLICKI